MSGSFPRKGQGVIVRSGRRVDGVPTIDVALRHSGINLDAEVLRKAHQAIAEKLPYGTTLIDRPEGSTKSLVIFRIVCETNKLWSKTYSKVKMVIDRLFNQRVNATNKDRRRHSRHDAGKICRLARHNIIPA